MPSGAHFATDFLASGAFCFGVSAAVTVTARPSSGDYRSSGRVEPVCNALTEQEIVNPMDGSLSIIACCVSIRDYAHRVRIDRVRVFIPMLRSTHLKTFARIACIFALGVLSLCTLRAAAAAQNSNPVQSAGVRDGSHDFDFIYGKWRMPNHRLKKRLP